MLVSVADAVQLAFVLEIRKDKQEKVESLLRTATEWAQQIVARERKARGNLVHCLAISQSFWATFRYAFLLVGQ